MNFDVVLTNGTVIDGTGRNPPAVADIGIVGETIAAVAPPDTLRGATTLDVGGRLVTPGFIDIHTHYDAQVLWDPALSPSCFQGVTTVIGGNCGFTLAPCHPQHRGIIIDTLESVEDMSAATLHAGIDWSFETFDEYLQTLSTGGLELNYASYVGHTALRLWAMGDEAHDREATKSEVDTMVAMARDALDAGAIGISTDRSRFHRGAGGRSVPTAVASRDEIEALMVCAGEVGAIVETNPDNEFAWLYDVASRVDCRITWTALVTYPGVSSGRTSWQDKREVHRRGWEQGARVHPQVTCRPLSVQLSLINPTPFIGAPAFVELMAVEASERRRFYEDRQWRERAREQLASGRFHQVRWASMHIAESNQADYVGANLAALAADTGRDPFDLLVDVALADDLTTRTTMIIGNDEPEAVSELLGEPGCLLGIADSGAHVGMLCDAGMPIDFLAGWVRDRKLMPVAEAVHRLTGEPAATFGLAGRGVIAPGNAADLVVLDWENLSPSPLRRVYDLPAGGDRLVADQVGGIDHVFVNGRPVGPGTGRVLRRS